MPEELESKLAKNAKLKAAFAALTPGRQRGYIFHFSQPKLDEDAGRPGGEEHPADPQGPRPGRRLRSSTARRAWTRAPA